MAQKQVKLDRESFSCSVCLDLLKDPVTTSCGHSYCMDCIQRHWDGEDEKQIYSCPQCRKTFTPRPFLLKNTMLSDLVEKTELQAAPADHCYAVAEDVACDVCTGRKLKALKSCLVCLVSYCDQHLQPHYESPAFEKHRLVEPSKNLQENICSHHVEVMKIFCRTDQQCICYLCTLDEHKGHDTVSAAAERTERQKELEGSQQNIQQRIQDREKYVKLLQQEVEAINHSADKAVEDSKKIFTELIRCMEKKRLAVERQVISEQKTEVRRVKELQEKLEQEITELKRKDAEMKKLSHTEDHTQFLKNYSSLSPLSESTDSPSIDIRPLRYFEDVTAAVSEFRDRLQALQNEKWTDISPTWSAWYVLQLEPKTRTEFLKYSRELTLDPNTANTQLLLSEDNRKVAVMTDYEKPSYSSHPDRFTDYRQVLSRESLTGRCYWEVEWKGQGVVIAVTHKDIRRTGTSKECRLGFNVPNVLVYKSWALDCYGPFGFYFYHNKIRSLLSGKARGAVSGISRVGVYLDQYAGTLTFYAITETMTLLHRVQTTFCEPLYVGLYVTSIFETAEFRKLK
ncbi:tripartite motif-containing protein 16-like [Perca flavescens]|uniref:tripartite motif-containing protein 16-like n=1 Tax=Perca flavescens TaxID=8167 RepID=UPI00106DFA39|nr:tripartite motif-containing protein 16-like [Perca flavescens]